MVLAPDDRRRIERIAVIRSEADGGRAAPNGIVGVEVRSLTAGEGEGVGLDVMLLFEPADGALEAGNLRIEGGVRRRTFVVELLGVVGQFVQLRVQPRGDFSNYVLRIVGDGDRPPAGFDPILSAFPFSFRPSCRSAFDQKAAPPVEGEELHEPRIDYLAKDYASFRSLMLDRLSRLKPDAVTDNAASLSITLVELFAYVGDRLSYKQDAVATEAYLDTCRRRISARRHARLLDYDMHDGCNARAFIEIRLKPGARLTVHEGCKFATQTVDLPVASRRERELATALGAGALIFEAREEAHLDARRNRIEIHDYGGALAGLDKGATRADLRDPDENVPIAVGDWLLLEQALGPDSGRIADADRHLRHIARITGMQRRVDPIGRKNADGSRAPLPLLEIRWDVADALPFALPLDHVVSQDSLDGIPKGTPDQPSAVVRANLILADHGRSLVEDTVEPGTLPDGRRFRPKLTEGPVTQALPPSSLQDQSQRSAAAILRTEPRRAEPQLTIEERFADNEPTGTFWWPQRDLIRSDSNDRHVVLEVDNRDAATLRFGDDVYGKAPDPEHRFIIRYRVGNAAVANVGAEAIAHCLAVPGYDLSGRLVTPISGQIDDIALIRNPLPATGGADPETIDDVRRLAPIELKTSVRAVTADDYAERITRRPDVQRAIAREIWTGSWRTILLIVDRVGGTPVDPDFEVSLRDELEPLRLMGHDLAFASPIFVPFDIALTICVDRSYDRQTVQHALEALFSNRVLEDGSKALFHPDVRSFGEPVRLSRLYAAARRVPGVVDVEVTEFKRLGATTSEPGLKSGVITLGQREIALLDNDPNSPDRGRLGLTVQGGQ